MTEHNWAANLTYTASAIHNPTTLEDAQELVASHAKVKALGTRHSFTDIADSPDGILLSLTDMPPDISIDRDAATVSVTAGTTYGVLSAELQRNGLALPNLGSLPHISVGGAIATATHGSGDTNGVLSTSVRALEVIQADGSMRRVDRDDADFPALAVGLGAFGVTERIELDVEPTFDVAQRQYGDASWDTVIDDLDEVMATAYSVSLLGDVGADRIQILWVKHKVGETPVEFPAEFHGGPLIDAADLPEDNPITTIDGVPGPWSRRLAHFRPDAPPSAGGDELQSEYYVDRRHGAAALDALRSLGDRISPHLHIMEIRTLAADELWLSPAYQRPSLCLGFTWRKHPGPVQALLPDIEAALADFTPRPHWGKLFELPDLAAVIPRLDDFLQAVESWDPDGKFWNPFLDRLTESTSHER